MGSSHREQFTSQPVTGSQFLQAVPSPSHQFVWFNADRNSPGEVTEPL
jgi:hypothetical protein